MVTDVQQQECLGKLLPDRPVGSYTFSRTALLGGTPLPQQHAVMPTVSCIHSPQTHEACLAKCNFRSHWLTTVVHELVNNLYIIQSSHCGVTVFGLLPLTSGTPFSLPYSETAFLAFNVSLSPTTSRSHPWESVLPPIWQLSTSPVHETLWSSG